MIAESPLVAEVGLEPTLPKEADFESAAFDGRPGVLRGKRSVTGFIWGPEMLIVGTVPRMLMARGAEEETG